jgi:hypothetical protein
MVHYRYAQALLVKSGLRAYKFKLYAYMAEDETMLEGITGEEGEQGEGGIDSGEDSSDDTE